MKVVEKVNQYGDTQIFEIIQSRKELASWLRDTLWDCLYTQYARDPVFNDCDTTVAWYDKEGKFYWISEGETVKRPNVAKIEKLVSTNGATVVIYGDVNIMYNERYGDWETDLD